MTNNKDELNLLKDKLSNLVTDFYKKTGLEVESISFEPLQEYFNEKGSLDNLDDWDFNQKSTVKVKF